MASIIGFTEAVGGIELKIAPESWVMDRKVDASWELSRVVRHRKCLPVAQGGPDIRKREGRWKEEFPGLVPEIDIVVTIGSREGAFVGV